MNKATEQTNIVSPGCHLLHRTQEGVEASVRLPTRFFALLFYRQIIEQKCTSSIGEHLVYNSGHGLRLLFTTRKAPP